MNQDIELSSDGTGDLEARLKEAVRAGQIASDMFDDTCARFFGINRTDGRCMDIIDRHGRITAGQLASEAGLTTGAVTAVIDRLEAAGYAQRVRDRADRRKVWIELTGAANLIGGRIFSHYQLLRPTVLEQFTPDQIDAILRFLTVGAEVNREQAALLERHVDPSSAGPGARAERAEAYERAAHALMAERIASLKRSRR